MRAAVLGSPISHSLSPVLHRAAYAALGLDDWTYDAIECDEAGLPALLAGCGPDWAGLSLTMPLKRAVLPLLDQSEPLVDEVGAANTVVFAAGRRHGHNTDVPGMIAALAEAGLAGVANSSATPGEGPHARPGSPGSPELPGWQPPGWPGSPELPGWQPPGWPGSPELPGSQPPGWSQQPGFKPPGWSQPPKSVEPAESPELPGLSPELPGSAEPPPESAQPPRSTTPCAGEGLPDSFPQGRPAAPSPDAASTGGVRHGGVLILGGGATACSALAAARGMGASRARVAVRDRVRAQDLLAAAGRLGMVVELTAFDAGLASAPDLLISTVPAGAADSYAQRLLRGDPAPRWVLDVVYHPWPTSLAVAARKSGAAVTGGLDLLLHQAAAQVTLMTGEPAPLAAMRRAGAAALGA